MSWTHQAEETEADEATPEAAADLRHPAAAESINPHKDGACVFVSVPVELGAGSENETRSQGELPVRDGAYRKLLVDHMLRRRCAL